MKTAHDLIAKAKVQLQEIPVSVAQQAILYADQSLTKALFGCQLPVIRERRDLALRRLLVCRRLRSLKV